MPGLDISVRSSKAARLASAQSLLGSSANSVSNTNNKILNNKSNNSKNDNSINPYSYIPQSQAQLMQDPASYFNTLSSKIQSIANKNNAWSAAQAQKQMDFQAKSASEAMAFNREEAQKNRDWQQYMSDTAHQREIKDLQKAGLNPVLSALGGSGAPVTSGATASGYAPSGASATADTSTSTALVGLLGSLLQAQTQLATSATSAASNLAVAEKNASVQSAIADLQSRTTLTTANINAAASKYVSDNGAAASRYGADRAADASRLAASISAAAHKYGYDVNAMTQKEIASFNAEINKELAQMGYTHEFKIKEAFPTNLYQAAGSLLGQGVGSDGFSGIFDAIKGIISNNSHYGGGVGRK